MWEDSGQRSCVEVRLQKVEILLFLPQCFTELKSSLVLVSCTYVAWYNFPFVTIFFNSLDKFNNLHLTPFYMTHCGISFADPISVCWSLWFVLDLREDPDQGIQAELLQENLPVRRYDAAHVAKLVSNLCRMLVTHHFRNFFPLHSKL